MGSRYLTDLADKIRAAGLPVTELEGWKTRARGSGGYESGRPTHIMCHHTGSPPSASGKGDANYCTYQDSDAPLANLCLDRDGRVWVCAAGATNTNGSGKDVWGGGVPENSMNSYAIGIEANGGYGSSWPDVQQKAYVTLVQCLMKAYNIPVGHVRAHFEWAPDRKTDPAGPSKYASGNNKWNMNAFRTDCGKEQEDDDLPLSDADIKKIADAVWAQDLNGTKAWKAMDIIQGTVRQFLGGWKDTTKPPSKTLLQQIHENTKK